MTDAELITIEQALRLSVRGLGPQSYTIEKVREALVVVQAIPHSAECDCDYCHERVASSSPELPPKQIAAIRQSLDTEYGDLVGYRAKLGAALIDLGFLLRSATRIHMTYCPLWRYKCICDAANPSDVG